MEWNVAYLVPQESAREERAARHGGEERRAERARAVGALRARAAADARQLHERGRFLMLRRVPLLLPSVLPPRCMCTLPGPRTSAPSRARAYLHERSAVEVAHPADAVAKRELRRRDCAAPELERRLVRRRRRLLLRRVRALDRRRERARVERVGLGEARLATARTARSRGRCSSSEWLRDASATPGPYYHRVPRAPSLRPACESRAPRTPRRRARPRGRSALTTRPRRPSAEPTPPRRRRRARRRARGRAG